VYDTRKKNEAKTRKGDGSRCFAERGQQGLGRAKGKKGNSLKKKKGKGKKLG